MNKLRRLIRYMAGKVFVWAQGCAQIAPTNVTIVGSLYDDGETVRKIISEIDKRERAARDNAWRLH